MTRKNVIGFGSVAQLLLVLTSGPAFADDVGAQFCWAIGKFDNTVYFAEAEGRRDRQASFVALLEVSGIEHHPAECRVSDSGAQRLARAELMRRWLGLEFEVVDTTFLSDLDY